MSQYDKIAKVYLETDVSLTKKYVATPTFFKILGATENKKIIDIGCGSGYSTRLMSNVGYLVGIDSSRRQIVLAKKIEKFKKQGTVYDHINICKESYKEFKEFDKATAFYLLHYAKTKKELFTMCKNIADCLKSGGKFVALNSNPDYPEQENLKYEILATLEKGRVEGTKRKITYLLPNKSLSFNTYFWKRKTYVDALKKAGFRRIQWHAPIVSQEGIDMQGKKFWKELIERPFICGLTAVKS